MSASTCLRCGRPTPDGYVCVSETGRAAAQLAEIRELTPAARDVAYGIVRRSAGGSGTGKPGSRSPGNDDAMDTLDEIQNRLTTLARDIAETRGVQIVSAALEGVGVPDPLAEACSWLSGQLEWLRHAVDGTEPYATRALDEIGDSARRMRGLVDGPAAQKYLGPCGEFVVAEAAESCPVNCTCHNGPQYACDEPGGCGSAGCGRARTTSEVCNGNVYVRGGAQRGRCRTCGAEVDVGERRAWLDDEVRGYAYTTSEIVAAYPEIRRNTINQWASRGRLIAHDHDGGGRARYNLGDVLDLAAAEAARREGDRATRARREAARAAESENAA